MILIQVGCWPNHLQPLHQVGCSGRHHFMCTIRTRDSNSSHVNGGACVCVCERTRRCVAHKYLGVFVNLFGLLHACWFLTFLVQCLRRQVGVTKVLVLVFACQAFWFGGKVSVANLIRQPQATPDQLLPRSGSPRPSARPNRPTSKTCMWHERSNPPGR